MSGELEPVDQDVDERDVDEPWVDPLDDWPEEIREYAKALRATALLYVLLRRSGQVRAFLHAYARAIDELLERARGDGGRAG